MRGFFDDFSYQYATIGACAVSTMIGTMPIRGLTELQAAFVREYATDFCAKAAAIRAGYSEPSARQTGYMLLRNPVVREQLVKHMEKASSASVMSQREVLERDSAIASVDPLAVFDLEGGEPRLRPLDQIPEEGPRHRSRSCAWQCPLAFVAADPHPSCVVSARPGRRAEPPRCRRPHCAHEATSIGSFWSP